MMEAEQRREKLERLNARLEESREELDERVRQVFEKKFKGHPEVSLEAFRYRFGYPKKKFRLRVEVAVDYGSFVAEGVFHRKLPGITFACSEEEILARFQENADFILEGVVRALPVNCSLLRNNLCTSPLFFRCKPKSGEGYRDEAAFAEFSRTLAGQVLPAQEEKVLGMVREDLERRQSALPSPAPWLAPGRAEVCHLEAGIEDLATITLHGEVQVRWRDVSLETVTVTGRTIWTEATTWSEADLASLLREEWADLALAAGKAICNALIPYQVIPPEKAPEGQRFPPELWSFLQQGNARMGHCTVLTGAWVWSEDPSGLTRSGPRTEPFFLGLKGPDTFQAAALPLVRGQRAGPLALGMEDLLSTADPLAGTLQHGTLAGTFRMLKVVAERYEREDFGNLPRPTLYLTVLDGLLTEARWEATTRKLTKQEQTLLESRPGAFAEELVRWVRQGYREQKQQKEKAALLLETQEEETRAMLRSISPLVLITLQTICLAQKKGCGIAELEAALPVQKDSVRIYLNRAFEVRIPVEGGYKPVVRDRCYSGNYVIQALSPALRSMLMRTQPGPYHPDDYPYLFPPERTRALDEQARRADTREKRWALLEILEKGVPRTAAAAFVKSETGQTFLRELEGDDREYARLLLEDLPGCKRLVGALLGPERNAAS